MHKDTKPCRRESITFKKLEDRMIIHNPKTKLVYLLNKTASEAWNLCDGNHAISDIENNFIKQYSVVPKHDMHSDIVEIIESFEKEGLLKAI
jgi:hypothetical protein